MEQDLKKKSKIPGVRFRVHKSRMYRGSRDKYFMIRYVLNNKQKEEALGWASQGWTEQKASEILGQLKYNIRIGRHPQTLAEMRENTKYETIVSNNDLNELKAYISQTIKSEVTEIFQVLINENNKILEKVVTQIGRK